MIFIHKKGWFSIAMWNILKISGVQQNPIGNVLYPWFHSSNFRGPGGQMDTGEQLYILYKAVLQL